MSDPIQLSTEQLKKIPVFGIAGNFAEHLSQAGEDADFLQIETAEPHAPKGMFPIYIPGHASFLGTFPLSHSEIKADFSHPINLQAEPEMCMLFSVEYEGEKIRQLTPQAFSVFNDCSIRKPNAKKISEKKNWGEDCTGIGENWLPCHYLEPKHQLDDYHLTSFIVRDGQWHEYGVDSPVKGYQYFYQKLKDWIQTTLNQQTDFGPLENLTQLLKQANWPKEIIVTFGATRYTPFGEAHYLQPQDQVVICLYNGQKIEKMSEKLQNQQTLPKNSLCLKQTVLAV